MVEGGGGLAVAQQAGKLIEGRNLYRTRAGELLLHAGDHRIGQGAPIRPDHSLSILPCRRLGVDIHGPQVGHVGHFCGLVSQFGSQHLVEVTGWVGADQQHLLASVSQRYRRGTSQGGFANAPLDWVDMPLEVGGQAAWVFQYSDHSGLRARATKAMARCMAKRSASVRYSNVPTGMASSSGQGRGKSTGPFITNLGASIEKRTQLDDRAVNFALTRSKPCGVFVEGRFL